MDKFRPPTNYSVKTNKGGYKILTEELEVPTWTTNSGKQSSRGGKRKMFDEDAYFDDDNDPPPPPGAAYDPFNPTGGGSSGGGTNDDDDEEVDPLDAFMAQNDAAAKRDARAIGKVKPKPKAVRDDIEKGDQEEQYYDFMKKNPKAGRAFTEGGDDGENEDIVYDEEGNAKKVKKEIDPLPEINHAKISYLPIEKNLYKPHNDVQSSSKTQINKLLTEIGIRIQGHLPQRPVSSFGHFNFPERLMERIRRADFVDPTPIQAAACPQILAGRDLIGIARTGSGKTAAFVWPLIFHCLKQLDLQNGDGPMAIVLAPTRELAQQIYAEVRKFSRNFGAIRAGLCFGGGSMYDQGKELKRGCEILVATPGRLIDHVKKGNTNLSRVSVLTIDEADRMFELGFESQVRSIANHIRPDRQCMLFSATFKKTIEHLARDILDNPIRVAQGDAGQVNKDVTQTVHIMSQDDKIKWLLGSIVALTSKGSVLVFVTRKADSVVVHEECKKHGYKTKVIHGDMHQAERNDVISDFKKRKVATLIATDVAARGLDISHVKTVVNFDAARNYDTHIHRVGRTGRAGNKGDAITLLGDTDFEYAALVVRSIESGKDEPPADVLRLAMRDQKFRYTRGKDGKDTGYQDSDRIGLGSKANEFEARFVEYSTPMMSKDKRKQVMGDQAEAREFVQSQPSLGEQGSTAQAARSSAMNSKLAMMRNSYKSQYGRNFTAATHTAEHTPAISYGVHHVNQGGSESYDPFNPGPASGSSSSSAPKERRKKSRWQ